MYAIALTTIPPRLPHLGPVLESLLAQRPAPARLLLCLPERWRRFPTPETLPYLPSGVDLVRGGADLGPAMKALPAARMLAGHCKRLIYCDDDWILPPGWAGALLAAQKSPGEAVTGAGFSVSRLGRCPARAIEKAGQADIAQGFSGVLIDPAWLCGNELEPPDAAWAVDDLWLSGHLARQGIALRVAPAARSGMRPAFTDAHGLQDAVIGGRDRHRANLACAALLHERYGIWPPSDRSPPGTARTARR